MEEFARRGLEPPTGASSPGYTIAVVSEWDTYYGRMLPKSLMGQLGTTEEDCEDDPAENAGLSHPCRVLRYSYLRGLDGEQPAVGAEKAKAPESGKAGTPKQESEKAAAQDRRTDVLVRGHQHVAERAEIRLLALVLGVVFLLAAWRKTVRSTADICTGFEQTYPATRQPGFGGM